MYTSEAATVRWSVVLAAEVLQVLFDASPPLLVLLVYTALLTSSNIGSSHQERSAVVPSTVRIAIN
jgi:hypothetical protein